MPAKQTRMRALVLKRRVERTKGCFATMVEAGGGVVGLGGGMRGVAGERCVASTLVDKCERKDEKEPRAEGRSASDMRGWVIVVSEGRWWGRRAESSVGCSSSTASSSPASAVFSLTGASDSVKPR